MNILITGCCGFIGFSLAKKLLLNKKNFILGVDCIDEYYDIKLKKERLKILKTSKNFKFFKFNLSNKKKIDNIFKYQKIDCVYHLAAQAGVRYSFIQPLKYINDILTMMNDKEIRLEEYFLTLINIKYVITPIKKLYIHRVG